MRLTRSRKPANCSWQTLRERADALGIPAWKLAEEYAIHVTPEEVMVQEVVKKV